MRVVQRYRLVVIHAAVVIVLTAAGLALDASTSVDDGANISAGLVMLPVFFLGLPWSLLVYGTPQAVGLAALLNVAIHAALTWRPLVLRQGRTKE